MTPKKILFVCLGNICRSPSAEAVMFELLKQHNLENIIELDSAGIIDYHEGELADSRMREHATKRGIQILHRSRPVKSPTDFDYFDLIIGMDNENIRALNALARTSEHKQKIFKMTDFRKSLLYDYVPDPYYGGSEGFELVLNILDDSCRGLLEKLS